MRKKLQKLLHGKAILIPLIALCAFGIVAGTITIAGSGSGTNSTAAIEQTKALSAQKQLVLDAIAKGDRQLADSAYKTLITEFEKNDALAEAVYKISLDYQYKNWNSMKANEGHKFVLDNFPTNSRYALLSGVELIRSQLRSGKNADSDVEKWMSTYKNQTEFASELPNAIYLIAQAYSNNKKDSQANPLFQYIANTYQKNLYGTLAQMRIDAINKNFDAADVVADYLIAHYRDNAEAESAIRSLAEYYRTNKEYERSIHFYTSIIDNYENTDDPVKPYTEIIYNLIDMKDTQGARDKIEAMQKDLAGNTKLARANFDIANYFLDKGDSVSALKLHKYNVENYTSILESLWSQAAIVWFHVRAGDEENAYIEYAKMLSIYKDEKTLAKEVAQVGDRYLETGNSEKARSLYNQVITEWPQSEYVLNARAGFIKADIHDGTDATILEDINDLITDFKDRKELPPTVMDFGNTYWEKGRLLRNKDFQGDNNSPRKQIKNELSDTTKAYYMNAKNVWGLFIEKLTSSTLASEACQNVAEAYKQLGEYEKAIENFNKVADTWPEYKSASYCIYATIPLYKNLQKSGAITESEAELKIKSTYEKLLADSQESAYISAAKSWLKSYAKIKAEQEKEKELISQIKQNSANK